MYSEQGKNETKEKERKRKSKLKIQFHINRKIYLVFFPIWNLVEFPVY